MTWARPRDFSLTTALCVSLACHALLLFRAAELYSAYTMAHLFLPGFEQQPPEPAQVLVALPPMDPWKRLGDSTGKGTAIAETPGAEPQIAPKANQDQPFLSLDAAGPGDIGDDPSESLMPKGNAAALAPELPEFQQPPGPQTPFGFAVPQGEFNLPIAPKTQLNEPGGPQLQSADAGTPGSDSAADPAPAGRMESDPTSIAGGVEFRQGATSVRLGRQAKITRPRISLSGRAEQFMGAGRVIVLKLSTDTDGNVTRAEVFRSSGSPGVDQPCKLAAYNWWFEPPKNPQGKPIEDVFLFTIRFI